MRSWVFSEYGGPIEPLDTPTPEPRGDEVLLRIEASGVCHSDVHNWEGFFDLGNGRKADLTRARELPFVLGHEIAGTVVAVGDGVSDVAVGDRRVVYPWIGCGACEVCAAGQEQVCARPRALGVNVAGGFADHVLVPAARYLLDFGDIPVGLACTYACSGLTAYGAIARIRDRARGESLLVIGAGGVGFAGLVIARAQLEGTRILVADVDDAKLEAAKRAGADETIDARDPKAFKAVLGSTNGGVAAAIDFVGSTASAGLGLGSLARGGRLVVVGLFGGALPLSLPLLPLKQIGLEGSYVGTLTDMKDLLTLGRAGRLAPIPTHERPLEQAAAAVADLRAGRVLGRTILRGR